jgi:hypothetical protein
MSKPEIPNGYKMTPDHSPVFTEAQLRKYARDCVRAAQKPWVGLTDEEIEQGHKESWVDKQAFESAVWWAEKKLKEKNHDH